MYVLITAMIILNLLFSFIDGIIVGDLDVSATMLTSSITANSTTIPVKNTGGFRTADWIKIGDEKIAYNGKSSTSFNYATRGYDGTEPARHNAGDMVYGRTSSMLNDTMGFNIVTTGTSIGDVSMMTLAWGFVTSAVPAMVSWNYYFLKLGYWVYLRLILMGISSALLFLLALQLLSALGGLLQAAWTAIRS